MKLIPISLAALTLLLVAQAASAQALLPGTSPFNPPPPAPPPPPQITAPKVPQFDAPPTYNYQPIPRNSFGDRISKCLDVAAGAGLSPADRGTYARSCANQ